jgi:hypothetical protein
MSCHGVIRPVYMEVRPAALHEREQLKKR